MEMEEDDQVVCVDDEEIVNLSDGCDSSAYISMTQSNYVLPFPPGVSYPTGLTNCSFSFHAAGRGDEYAFDFDMPDGSDFHAARRGRVLKVVENQPNSGNGTAGNYVVLDHGDKTFGLYYHSPPDGILVEVGDVVERGQKIGVTGTSGYAGYPHLHFIVVKDQYNWPYSGVPISFKNVYPKHTVLKSSFPAYTACEY